MIELHSPRLRLIALDHSHLRLLQAGREQLEKTLGLQPSRLQHSPDIVAEIEGALDFWLKFAEAQPAHYAWGTNWEIVDKALNQTVGGIGLGGGPDHQGISVLGYAIDLRFHNQGIATESLKMLVQWAFQEPLLSRLRAYTPRTNYASQRVLQKCGFVRRGEENELVIWERRGD